MDNENSLDKCINGARTMLAYIFFRAAGWLLPAGTLRAAVNLSFVIYRDRTAYEEVCAMCGWRKLGLVAWAEIWAAIWAQDRPRPAEVAQAAAKVRSMSR